MKTATKALFISMLFSTAIQSASLSPEKSTDLKKRLEELTNLENILKNGLESTKKLIGTEAVINLELDLTKDKETAVKQLVECGANINREDSLTKVKCPNNLYTHKLLSQFFPDLFSNNTVLLENNVDPNSEETDSQGKNGTSLQIAKQKGLLEILEPLRDSEADADDAE